MTYFAFACALILGILFLRASRKLRNSEEYNTQLRRDIRNRNEARNKTHQREIQRLLDALPYPFFSISEKGHVIRINRHSEEIFEDRDIKDRSIRQVFLDSPIYSSIKSVLDTPAPYRGTLRLPPGSPFSSRAGDKDSHWEIDVRPLALQSNSLEVQLMMRDITASVHADQVRQDFVANASHELRTPLSIISGYLENLTEEGGLDNKALAQKMLNTMDRHVVRINCIVEDMLVISKLESDEAAPLKLAPFNIAGCVRDIIERLEPIIEQQKASVEVNVPGIQITGDHFYWTQILFNLVENALKQNTAAPVTIRIDGEQNKKGNFTIRITDNGIGIPGSDLPFIFKRFYRVEKHHTQSQVKGTGLGLSIVKRAIEAHGGNISAASTPGDQTIFTITLPPIEAPNDRNEGRLA